MQRAKSISRIVIALTLVVTGCATVPRSQESRAVLRAETNEAFSLFKAKYPMIQLYLDHSYGYAIFPKVAKGAFWLGGAYGRGQVYEQNKLVGYSSLSQATLGFSFGGQYFRELIFFETQEAFNQFISGQYTFSAQVTGTAFTEGMAAKADYEAGLAVFVIAESGLMIDASLGGQRFEFSPVPRIIEES